jgi:predicted 3-demethylubiquinone-9 3-methyltransferase (glyoxalase superfamily)
LTVEFSINGQDFTALNGGPVFRFNPAVSFAVDCKTQKEIDVYWEKLSKGGKKGECGWLTDKYGLSWQIVPSVLPKLLQDRDKGKSQRVMAALIKMKKLDIGKLQLAAQG